MEDTNVSDGNALMDEVKINLNMLCALVLDEFGGEVDGADVVTIDQSGLRQGAMQLHKQLTKPTCHWPRHSTPPQCSNMRQYSSTWRTRK
jgi:hypothetical protein